MAYFSKIDSNNKVIDSVKVEDSVIMENGVLSEQKGQEFLRKIFKEPNAIWKRSNKDMLAGVNMAGGEVFRKNFGCVGSSYDPERDVFIGPKGTNPDGSERTTMVFNYDKCVYEYPTPRPTEPGLWAYGDIGGWKNLADVTEGKTWDYNSTDGWVEIDL